MKNINVILRLVNSLRKIDVAKYEQLCEATYLLALDVFPFCMVVSALHRIFGHTPEKMRRMGNRGLVSLLLPKLLIANLY